MRDVDGHIEAGEGAGLVVKTGDDGSLAAELEAEAGDGATFTAGVVVPPGAGVEQIIELVVRAYPDIVPEMLAGDSVDALLASVPAAREAYARVAATLEAQTPAPIPTGAGRRPPLDVEALSPEGKIRVGIREVGNR